jgi:hypothetical protein
VTYGTQSNRNRGSISVYFRFCRDECLRLWADLDRLHDSRSDSRSDSGRDSRSDSRSDSGRDSGRDSDD